MPHTMSETTMNGNGMIAQLPLLEQKPKQELGAFEFEWLHNEALLRDEGVYYGLVTEQHPQEKLDTIDSFFEEYIARTLRSIELQEEGLRYFDESIEEGKTTLRELKASLQQTSTAYHYVTNEFWKLVGGIVAYSVIVLFMFWLPYELFGPKWSMPTFITLGVFLFGLISHYHRPSWWYERVSDVQSKKPNIWKTVLEEVGIPVSATFFILAWGADGMSVLQIISYALLLLLFFFFVGKGLLNYLSQLPPQFKIVMENVQQNRFRKSRVKQIELEINKQEVALDKLLERRITLVESKMENTVQVALLQRKKETYKNYFLSEFQLAKESRKHFILENTLGNRK